MKSVINYLPALLVFTFGAFSSNWASAGSSSGTRGGGNMNAAEFYEIGDSLLEALNAELEVRVESQTISIASLKRLFAQTHVQPVAKSLKIDSVSVDAINYPDINRIELSEPRWTKRSREQKIHLVAHELLGLARITDSGYRVSQGLVNAAFRTTTLDASQFSDEKTCAERREIVDERARSLISTLVYADVRPKAERGSEIYEMRSLVCRIADGVFDDGIARGECSSKSGLLASPFSLITVMQTLGLYGEPGMSHVYYAIDDLRCEVKIGSGAERPTYKCQIRSNWSFGCGQK